VVETQPVTHFVSTSVAQVVRSSAAAGERRVQQNNAVIAGVTAQAGREGCPTQEALTGACNVHVQSSLGADVQCALGLRLSAGAGTHGVPGSIVSVVCGRNVEGETGTRISVVQYAQLRVKLLRRNVTLVAIGNYVVGNGNADVGWVEAGAVCTASAATGLALGADASVKNTVANVLSDVVFNTCCCFSIMQRSLATMASLDVGLLAYKCRAVNFKCFILVELRRAFGHQCE